MKKMNQETKNFMDNVDSWIKQIRSEFNNITDVSDFVEENINNIQHNYELIYELKEEIDNLKGEIRAIKLMQLVTLKENLVRKDG